MQGKRELILPVDILQACIETDDNAAHGELLKRIRKWAQQVAHRKGQAGVSNADDFTGWLVHRFLVSRTIDPKKGASSNPLGAALCLLRERIEADSQLAQDAEGQWKVIGAVVYSYMNGRAFIDFGCKQGFIVRTTETDAEGNKRRAYRKATPSISLNGDDRESKPLELPGKVDNTAVDRCTLQEFREQVLRGLPKKKRCLLCLFVPDLVGQVDNEMLRFVIEAQERLPVEEREFDLDKDMETLRLGILNILNDPRHQDKAGWVRYEVLGRLLGKVPNTINQEMLRLRKVLKSLRQDYLE